MTKLAFVFPEQGSQSVGMMQPFAGLPAIGEVLAQAAEVLKQDLWKLAAEGPAEQGHAIADAQMLGQIMAAVK